MKPSLIFLIAIVTGFSALAQIPISSGSYSQNFNSLATSGTANVWAENSTIPGWYASTGITATVSVMAPGYRAGIGDSIAGALWSFGNVGVNALTDRAFGALGSGTYKVVSFGVRFTNDTGVPLTNFAVSYTGEMWRVPNGATATTNTLAFSYRIDGNPITNADAGNVGPGWTSFSALDFKSSYITTGSGFAVDGNDATNRQVFDNIVLAGVVLQPGQELFLRWRKVDNIGSDGGLAIDDLTVDFGIAVQPTAPSITVQPQSQTVTEGDNVTFTVIADGTPPLSYQWQFNSTNVDNATNDTFTLTGVTTNDAGDYSVTVTNILGFTNSEIATLTVSPLSGTLKLVHYNVKGNSVEDWSTNSAQVRAIGRELMYLNPDIITFNEIPLTNTYQLANWAKDFLKGYNIASNSGTDGYIRSAIASRFPITRSQKWLDGADLNPFGYTNANFTRDLFETEIAVPNLPQHLHVFTTHLKSGQGTDDSNRRTAEAAAITNFLATNFFVLYPNHPYTLSGDMNEDINRPPSSNPQSIQRFISAPTGIRLTTPLNPVTHSDLTHSIQDGLDKRYDYILPCTLLFSNIASAQVFRTDKLIPLPPNLNSNDCEIASDHLPVVMVFNNPYNKPFQILSVAQNNQSLTLSWESVPGQPYRVEVSSNLTAWTTFASNLVATTYLFNLTTNTLGDTGFFRVRRGP